MVRVSIILYAMLCFITLNSCTYCDTSYKLKNFMSHTINMPDSLLKIHGTDSIMIEKNKLAVPSLIVYVDENSCTSCKISHLIEYTTLFEMSKNNQKFDIMIIFSPKEADYNRTKNDLILSGFEYPVFLDSKGEFIRLNENLIPKDSRFHAFLLNTEYRPVYVGDPTQSGKLWEIFLQTLEDIK